MDKLIRIQSACLPATQSFARILPKLFLQLVLLCFVLTMLSPTALLAQQGTAAGCLITNADKKILFVKDTWSGRWSLPGGRCGKETPRQCAEREAKEEIGLKFTAGDLFLQAEKFKLFDCHTSEMMEFFSSSRGGLDHLWVPMTEKHEIRSVAFIEPGTDIPWSDPRWKFLKGSLLLKNQFENQMEFTLSPSPSKEVKSHVNYAQPYQAKAARLSTSLQKFSWLDIPMKVSSFLSEELFFILLIPLMLLVLRVPQHRVWQFLLLLMICGAINQILKFSFNFPRPSDLFPAMALSKASGHGFPSGHTMAATVCWLFLFSLHPRIWTGILGGLLIISGGFSRIYLGVHFYHDVVFGWLFGGLVLALVWLLLGRFRTLVFRHFLIAFFITLGCFCFTFDPGSLRLVWICIGVTMAFKFCGINQRKTMSLPMNMIYWVLTVAVLAGLYFGTKYIVPEEGYTTLYITIVSAQSFLLGFLLMYLPIKFSHKTSAIGV